MLSERLKYLRKTRGLNQQDLANILQITRGAYSMYEIGSRQMDYEALCTLANFYDVSTDYLLGRVNKEEIALNTDEKNILNEYRALDERGKDNIKAILKVEYQRNQPKKDTKKSVM